MRSYLDLLRKIRFGGAAKTDRTGTGTYSLFGEQLRIDLSSGFPLLTTKKLHFKSIAHELLWMLSGSTNVHDLQKHGVTIWDEWATENGDLGPVYGKQWRAWEGADNKIVDQIKAAESLLRSDPHSRRNVISAWNVVDIPAMRLAPCHCLFQFYVANNKLSCHLYQRSADIFLGVPYNIASYALLTTMMARVSGLALGELVISFGDVHLYSNHIDQADVQLVRAPKTLPDITLMMQRSSVADYRYDDISLIGYGAHPAIKAPVAV